MQRHRSEWEPPTFLAVSLPACMAWKQCRQPSRSVMTYLPVVCFSPGRPFQRLDCFDTRKNISSFQLDSIGLMQFFWSWHFSRQGEPYQWAGKPGREWMEMDPEAAGVLSIDDHVRVCNGHQTELPRHYVSRQKLCLRATAVFRDQQRD
jgi:hypothetical protein